MRRYVQVFYTTKIVQMEIYKKMSKHKVLGEDQSNRTIKKILFFIILCFYWRFDISVEGGGLQGSPMMPIFDVPLVLAPFVPYG